MVTNFIPSVTAPLECWDNTTDAIIWLIEQKTEYHLDISRLELEQLPEWNGRQGFWEFLESQTAELKGWPRPCGNKEYFKFYVEFTYLVDPETGNETDGYTIAVEKKDCAFKWQKFASYKVLGSSRDNFTILEESIIEA
jgi:hypothetical protein